MLAENDGVSGSHVHVKWGSRNPIAKYEPIDFIGTHPKW